MISRRSVVLTLGWLPLLARAAPSQATAKPHHVGLLTAGAPLIDGSEIVAGLTAGLAKRGYVVGSTLIFERRAAEAHPTRLPELVDELKRKVQLIIADSDVAARAVKAGSTIPVVAITGADPVKTGLIDSLARPGGTITGVGEIAAELSGKRLELLREAFPGLRKIAMIWNADDLGMTMRYSAAGAAARNLGFEIQALGVSAPEDFAGAFAAMTQSRPDGILMVTDALTVLNREKLFDFAARQKLPAIYEYDFLVREGGLMSYGPDMSEVYDRASELVDRVLKGESPAQLPFEQPTRFRFAINKKALDRLGLPIPTAVLSRADEIVE